MNIDARRKWIPLAVLAIALVVWAAALALGAFLELGADDPRHDLRKPMLVLGTMALFLAIWGLALWIRGRRQREK